MRENIDTLATNAITNVPMLRLLHVAARQPKNVHNHTQQQYQIYHLIVSQYTQFIYIDSKMHVHMHVSFRNLTNLGMAGSM